MAVPITSCMSDPVKAKKFIENMLKIFYAGFSIFVLFYIISAGRRNTWVIHIRSKTKYLRYLCKNKKKQDLQL